MILGSPPRNVEEHSAEEKEEPEYSKVNEAITCEHGRLRGGGNRTWRTVSADTWNKIKAVFPDVREYTSNTAVSRSA